MIEPVERDLHTLLGICAGGIRAYLHEQHALPDASLVAMVPMSLRPPHPADPLRPGTPPDADADTDRDGTPGAGNRLAVLLCPLGTDELDPRTRLDRIASATTTGKRFYRALPAPVATALSGLLLAPLGLTQLPVLGGRIGALTPPLFNLVISTTPGPRHPLYWHGARLDACYPLSIPIDGLGVNITCAGTATTLDIGITSSPDALPDPDRLMQHLHTALTTLENRI